MNIKHKLINLIDKLEKSIGENSRSVWMHDLSDTVYASFSEPTDYHLIDSEGKVEVVEYKGWSKEFDNLKETIYNMEAQ
tara:strand:- start:469 stop:705 length:237 start_codon:yes stop_codon:yes gene_type:complete